MNRSTRKKKSRQRKHDEIRDDAEAHKAERRHWAQAKKDRKRNAGVIAEHALREHRKRETKYRGSKKQGYGSHFTYFECLFSDLNLKCVRDPAKWVPKNYNLHKQRISFLRWILCIYRVPEFLVDSMIRPITGEGSAENKRYMEWTVAVGQGGSLYKLAKDYLTRKECHAFLKGPAMTVQQNIWFARGACAGATIGQQRFVVEKLLQWGVALDSTNWIEFVRFVGANSDEFNRENLSQIMDFLRANFGDIRTLSKRTVSSLTRLSNDWHARLGARVEFAKKARDEWAGLGLASWRYQRDPDPTVWFVDEILDSTDLYTEGNKLRHCVGSYVGLCTTGRTHIFSLRSQVFQQDCMFTRHATVEVLDGRIRQVSGRGNRRPKKEEISMVRRWAHAMKFNYVESIFTRRW
jgi:hypothetical protein